MKERSLVSFDWALKRLLRHKANFEVLEGFLSELLRRKIVIMNIGESEGNVTAQGQKTNQVDVLAEIKPERENLLIEVKADDKEIVIIEMQFDNEDDYFQRMLYGVSKAITDYMSRGDKYDQVRKVYSINIVYFDLGTGDDYVYQGITKFNGLHTGNELELSPRQKGLYTKDIPGELYPEYYIIKVGKFDNVAKDTLDEWIYYLKNNKIRDDFTAQGFDKAREILMWDNLSPEEKIDYENSVKAKRIRDSEITTAFTDGEIKGEIKGIAKGEIKKATEIALKLSKMGMSIEDISNATELAPNQITEILNPRHNDHPHP
jgi:hypothetical protein